MERIPARATRRAPARRAALALATAALVVLGLAGAPPAGAQGAAAGDVAAGGGDDVVSVALEAHLDAVGDHDAVPVVVTLASDRTDAAIARIQAEVGPFDVTRSFHQVPAFSARLTREQLDDVVATGEVAQVEEDAPVHADTDRARRDTGVDLVRAQLGLTGDAAHDGDRVYGPADVVVAVVDTGVDDRHVDLDGGKVLASVSFVQATATCPATSSPDDNGHGTHVASTIASDGDSGSATLGIAPGAAIVSVKVLDCKGNALMSTVNLGIEWVLAHQAEYGIDAMNLSLGSASPSSGTDPASKLLNRAAASGIAVFQSAGNSGPRLGTVTGQATAKYAITVGAAADTGIPGLARQPQPGWSLAGFSSRGPTQDGRTKPDVVAPGVGIVAARADTVSGHLSMSGTSMAAPVVAGIGALILEADPTRAPGGVTCASSDTSPDCRDGVVDATMHDGVRDALVGTAVPAGPDGADDEWGAGIVDAAAAVASVQGGVLHAPRPDHGQVGGSLPAVGAVTTRTVEVDDVRWPLVATVVMADWSVLGDGSASDDVAVSLTRADGTVVATVDPDVGGLGTRQQVVAWWPDRTGSYRLVVRTTKGAGTWWAEISGGAPSGGTFSAPQGTVSTPLAGLLSGSAYVPLQPTRVLDTRAGAVPLGAGEARHLVVAGTAGVPASASAVVLNLTGTAATTATYVTVWPGGGARPNASNLNLVPGATTPNLVITGLGADGGIDLYNDQGRADVIVDVVGYLAAGTAATPPASYTPLQPQRALDTRTTTAGALGAGEARRLVLSGRDGVPMWATAVVLNLTGTDPTAATYVTVWPSGAARPTASTLNLVPGATAPNLVITGLGPDGGVDLYNDQGSTHVIADVVGYLAVASPEQPATTYTPVQPQRVLDTRGSSLGALHAGEVRAVDVRGGVVPPGATAVVLNLTGTEPSAATYVTVWPGGAQRPTASTLNLVPGATRPNLVIVGLGAGGQVDLYNDQGTTHVVADVVGYLGPA